MKGSLAGSLGLHAAILTAALVVLPNSALKEAKPVEAIMVDITTIGDVTKKMAMAADAEKAVDKPKSKKAEVVKAPEPKAKADEKEVTTAKPSKPKTAPEPPPEPEPEKKVEPKPPEPTPLDSDPLKDLIKDTIEPEPEKKVEPKPEKKPEPEKPKPEKKKEKKQAKLDVAALEDILNSDALVNKENEQKTTNASEATEDGNPSKGETNLEGSDNVLSATILQALVQRVRECWAVPPGAREASIIVKLRFALNPDGSIAGTPMVMNAASDPLYDVTARSAVAAVMECQNYDFLPQDKYDLWKDLIINFNPNMSSFSNPT